MIQNEEFLLIDIDASCTGHPLFDLAAHQLSHYIYSLNSKAVLDALGVTSSIARRMAELTSASYFEGIEPDKARIYKKAGRHLIVLILLTVSAKVINSPLYAKKARNLHSISCSLHISG